MKTIFEVRTVVFFISVFFLFLFGIGTLSAEEAIDGDEELTEEELSESAEAADAFEEYETSENSEASELSDMEESSEAETTLCSGACSFGSDEDFCIEEDACLCDQSGEWVLLDCERFCTTAGHISDGCKGFPVGNEGEEAYRCACVAGCQSNEECSFGEYCDDGGRCIADCNHEAANECQDNAECADDGRCACLAATCESLGFVCGEYADGCGNMLDCGGCDEGYRCNDEGQCEAIPECIAETCESLEVACGSWSDGCNDMLDCGDCPTGQSCDASGQCITDDCVSKSCDELGFACGVWENNCGYRTDCGECEAGEICDENGRCVAEAAADGDMEATETADGEAAEIVSPAEAEGSGGSTGCRTMPGARFLPLLVALLFFRLARRRFLTHD